MPRQDHDVRTECARPRLPRVTTATLSRARLTTALAIGTLAWPSAAFARTDPPSPLPSAMAADQASAPRDLRSPDTRDAAPPDQESTPRDWRTLDTRSAVPVQGVASAPKSGDTPVDHPGASRTPEYTAPTTIQVVRPERTIVHDADELLPVVLSSAALLIAVGGSALLLTGSVRRRRPRSSH
jgi:hypothetical protein